MQETIVSVRSVGFNDVFFSGEEWKVEQTIAFMQNWVPISFGITAVYLLAIYLGQRVMLHRKAFELDGALTAWNFAFSLFSLIATIKLVPELIWSLNNLGFVGSYCFNAEYYTNPSTGFWGWLFVMSKAPELFDTAFLVLRKKPVIFMHWYHHAMTFLYAQITYSEKQAWCRWSLALNLTVHSIMYFYFAIRAMKYSTPRWVAKFVTTIQLVQFVVSCYIFGHLFIIKTTNSVPDCACSWNVLSIGGVMYLSYLYLFADFFYKAYIQKRSPTKAAATANKSDKAA